MKACPTCKRLVVIPICYGKPTDELLEAANDGLCFLGGCAIEGKSPNWHCKSCGFEWLDDSADHQSSVSLNEIRQIVNSNLFSIFTGMILTGHGPGPFGENSLTDYGRLKTLLNIDRGIGVQTLERIASNCRSYPNLSYKVTQSLARHLAIYILRQSHEFGERSLGELLFFAAIALTHVETPLTVENPNDKALEDFERFLRDFNFHAE